MFLFLYKLAELAELAELAGDHLGPLGPALVWKLAGIVYHLASTWLQLPPINTHWNT